MHVPVLQKEVLKYLDPKPNENFIDCTIGEAGHTLAILEKNAPYGKVLGIDWDKSQISCLRQNQGFKANLKNRLILISDNFVNLREIVEKTHFKRVSGILFDLGFSSWHLEASQKGFSFLRNEPLDMRYGQENPLTAEKILNYWSEIDIERILRDYGEEKFSERIAEEIIEARKVKSIKSTFQLIEIIKRTVPAWYQHRKNHYATKTFQALRIAVNDELNNLAKALPQAVEILNHDGRLVTISFHSLEDRIVKNFLREQAKEGLLKILTKKPIQPTKEEVINNPRSRSAKLRAAQKNE